MGLLATIKTRGAATVIWEYDPDGRCENLVRAEQKDLVMLLKESPIPRQSSPTILSSLNAFHYLCRLSVGSNITLALGIQLFALKVCFFIIYLID